jgi:hypothetical protein
MPGILRKIIKWSIRIVAVVLIVFAMQLTVLAFPQPFFSHKMETDYGTVYSDKEFTPELINSINDVSLRLKAVELYGPEKDDCIFICHSKKLYSFFARLTLVTPMAQGYNLSVFHNSFVSMTRLHQLRDISGGFPPYAITEGNPAHTIVHELVHQYIVDEIGFWANRKTPPMKLEGLAEYGSSIAHIRSDAVHTLPRRIDILLNDNHWYAGYDRVREHYKAALVIEYLAEIEGYRFADMIDDSVTIDGAYRDMIQWR